MRNLKKVLTLVLTVAMLLSVMVVGTGAAFSDQDQIKNKEAVDACSALNIIGGMEDGSYRPANNVTRAQMCKMICVALNGGKEPTLGTNATPTFSDVRTDPSSSWAESFIESCNSQGIVSGVGGGRFSPSGSVTGTQAARMLLVALGYRADQEGFTGDAWAINVNTIASAKGLYKGIESIDANAALSRDNAAQMIWNALNAYEVEYVSQLTTVNGQLTSKLVAQDKVVGQTTDKITLLEDKYEAVTRTGTLSEVTYDSSDKDYNTKVTPTDNVMENGAVRGIPTFNASKDYSSLMGQQVKAMYTYDNRTKDTVLLGIYATNRNHTVSFVAGDMDDFATTKFAAKQEITVDDTKYTLANSVDIVAPNGEEVTNAEIAKYHEVTLVDNNNDSKYECVVVNPFYVSKVTSVTSEKYYFTGLWTANSAVVTSLDVKDCAAYDGIAKDDFAIVSNADYTVSGDNEITKANVINGEVSATKGTSKTGTESFRVDGTWYEAANNTVGLPDAGATLRSAVIVNGYYFDQDASSKSSVSGTVVVLATDSNASWNANGYYDATLLFADGTKETVKAAIEGTGSGNTGKPAAETNGNHAAQPKTDTIYTYTKKDAGYLLNKVTAATDIDLENGSIVGAGTYSSKSNNITISGTNYRVATDAVVFVKYDGTNGTVITGADADAWSDSRIAVPVYAAGIKNTVKVMYLNLSGEDKVPGASSDTHYAVILSDVIDAKDDNKMADLWTSNGGLVEGAVIKSDSSLAKNMVYEYTMDGDEYELKAVAKALDNGKIKTGTFTAAVQPDGIDGNYITVYYRDTDNSIQSGTFLMTKDTVSLYVDSKAGTGANEGSLAEAVVKDQTAGKDNYIPNVIIVVDDDTSTENGIELGAIVVDLQNNMRDASGNEGTITQP